MGEFYHGTSTALGLRKWLLPNAQTGVVREGRAKRNDEVYVTNCILSAKKYAVKAAKKFGGAPIVYIVRPKPFAIHRIDTEFTCDMAKIIGVLS